MQVLAAASLLFILDQSLPLLMVGKPGDHAACEAKILNLVAQNLPRLGDNTFKVEKDYEAVVTFRGCSVSRLTLQPTESAGSNAYLDAATYRHAIRRLNRVFDLGRLLGTHEGPTTGGRTAVIERYEHAFVYRIDTSVPGYEYKTQANFTALTVDIFLPTRISQGVDNAYKDPHAPLFFVLLPSGERFLVTTQTYRAITVGRQQQSFTGFGPLP